MLSHNCILRHICSLKEVYDTEELVGIGSIGKDYRVIWSSE